MSEAGLVRQPLPASAPARVLACGAWLKNTACLLERDQVWMSPLHGDLGTESARLQLLASVEQLQQCAGGPIEAVAHDLHPDFFSTAVAQQLAQKLGVPAIAVQHHHAHIAQVQAQRSPGAPVFGWALDGVGLGTDQTAWGGELLSVDADHCQRLAHLPVLALPGGDVAAQEPWRMAAALLHRLKQPQEPWLATDGLGRLRKGELKPIAAAKLQVIGSLLKRGIHSPPTSSAGRWFDAVAGVLGVCWWQTAEAQAAVALEQLAYEWWQAHPQALPGSYSAAPFQRDEISPGSAPSAHLHAALEAGMDALVLRMLTLFAGLDHDTDQWRATQAHAAAMFHAGLADLLGQVAIAAVAVVSIGEDGSTRPTAVAKGAVTQRPDLRENARLPAIALCGGCFYNRILRTRVAATIEAAGLTVALPLNLDCGDAGLALGQAWVAAHALANARAPSVRNVASTFRNSLCV